MKLVDIGDSKSPAAMRGGSSPPTGTNKIKKPSLTLGFFIAPNSSKAPIFMNIYKHIDSDVANKGSLSITEKKS